VKNQTSTHNPSPVIANNINIVTITRQQYHGQVIMGIVTTVIISRSGIITPNSQSAQ